MLAYFDSFAGLVPCKVTKITEGSYGLELEARLTAARRGYQRGETVSSNARHIVPTTAVYRSRQHSRQYRIRSYSWRELAQSVGFPIKA